MGKVNARFFVKMTAIVFMTALKKTTCDALDCWIFFFSLHYKGKRKPPAISSNTSVTDGINKQDREQRVSTKRAEGRWETERHGGPQVNGKVSTQKNKLKGKTGKFGKCSERERRKKNIWTEVVSTGGRREDR